MQIKKQYVHFIFSFCFMMLCVSPGFSQTLKSQPVESVGLRSPLTTGYDQLNKEVCNYFADELKAIGKKVDWNSHYELLVSAADISQNMVAVNVVSMSAMPKELENYNVKNEVLYLNIAKKKKLPPEGKDVREYVTRDYVREFKRPGWGQWIICKKSDLKNECKKFIDEFMNDGWKSME